MSTMMIKVCEECGKQETSRHSWLVIENIDIKSAETNENVVKASTVDLCSPGCLLRYVSKAMDAAANGHSHTDYTDVEEQKPAKAFI